MWASMMDKALRVQLDRIEAKLDALLEALAEEEDEGEPELLSLDGEYVGSARDAGEEL
jgi:hypothetical protein